MTSGALWHAAVCMAFCLAIPAAAGAADWPMWGGTPQRNMVNTVEKNIPDSWDVTTGKNIKWVAQLGSQSYGNPMVAGGKVFVGTNNHAERQPKVKGDKGVVMCFRESDGKFLWQIVPRQAGRRPRQRLAQAGHLLVVHASTATASTTSATAASWSAPTRKASTTARTTAPTPRRPTPVPTTAT